MFLNRCLHCGGIKGTYQANPHVVQIKALFCVNSVEVEM